MAVQLPVCPIDDMAGVHYWDQFFPDSGVTITQCNRTIPYGRNDLIVSWDEKPATCPDCVAISMWRTAEGVA